MRGRVIIAAEGDHKKGRGASGDTHNQATSRRTQKGGPDAATGKGGHSGHAAAATNRVRSSDPPTGARAPLETPPLMATPCCCLPPSQATYSPKLAGPSQIGNCLPTGCRAPRPTPGHNCLSFPSRFARPSQAAALHKPRATGSGAQVPPLRAMRNISPTP